MSYHVRTSFQDGTQKAFTGLASRRFWCEFGVNFNINNTKKARPDKVQLHLVQTGLLYLRPSLLMVAKLVEFDQFELFSKRHLQPNGFTVNFNLDC